MSKSRPLPYRIDEEWLKALSGLAGTFGASAEEVIHQSLPDVAVTRLFFQCKDYMPELRWDEVAEIGREAIRKYLRAKYMQGIKEHLARMGLSMEQSSAENVEAARQRALDEMSADAAHQPAHQLAKAQEDSVYLGCLYDAWKRAKANEPGYTIEKQADNPHAAWAVLRNNQIL